MSKITDQAATRRMHSILERAARITWDRPEYAQRAGHHIRAACHAVDRLTDSHMGTRLWNTRLADTVFATRTGTVSV